MKNKKKFIASIVVGLVLLFVIIIVIVNVMLARKELNTYVEKKENLYIYFGRERFDINGNLTINHDGNISNLKINNKKTKLYGEPIYYSKAKKIIIPVNYSFVSYSNGVQKKVPYFTVLSEKYDDYYLTNKNLNYKANKGFLFDGSDYYIFINNCVVNFNGMSVKITPFSFVNYVYDTNELFIYDYASGKMNNYENVTGDVFVTNDEFKLNVSSDLIIINNKEKLLMKNFDYLKKLK